MEVRMQFNPDPQDSVRQPKATSRPAEEAYPASLLAVLTRPLIGVLVTTFICCGCDQSEEVVPERRPRPVIVNQLRKQTPPQASMVSASAGSWKTEQIGFEVTGRVEYVVEPNTAIEGRISDKEGNLILKGTPIGQLDSERYSLQVAKAEADVARAEQNLEAAQIELTLSLKAQMAAATASRDLAATEYDRSKRLFAQRAGARGDVDRDKANFESAEAQIKQLEAAQKGKAAEIKSLENAKLQADKNLEDAQRNLADCTLYASFNGQIADISVVPGSVVSAGQPVATLQMMDPIKVEFEVSAEVSRRLQNTERLPVEVSMPDGSKSMRDGYLYLIDPVADPLTRTFTVTLLVMNEQLAGADIDSEVATTRDLWRLDFKFLPGAKDNMLFIEEKAIMEDEDGDYLWMITNMTIEDQVNRNVDQLKVRKLRVTRQSLKVPFLGNWVFQNIRVDDAEFDPTVNMVVGELNVSSGEPSDWNGDTVIRRSEGQWMLRPGDLVRVDLTDGDEIEGYYVPMDAITRKQGESFIFAVEQSGDGFCARQVPVKLGGDAQLATTSSLRRIEPVEADSLEGMMFVVEGAHYLIDGEPVKVIERVEVTR